MKYALHQYYAYRAMIGNPQVTSLLDTQTDIDRTEMSTLTFKRRIKSHLPFAGIIRSSPYSTRFQDKG